MNSTRDKIWYLLADCKTNEKFSGYVLKKYQLWDFALNVFLALMTSASVASWAYWQTNQGLWITLIAISQVLSITKPYFLFPKYIKAFAEKVVRWQEMSIDVEELWESINRAPGAEEDCNKKYFELKRQIAKFDSLPEELIFFGHYKQLNIAEQYCNNFLKKV